MTNKGYRLLSVQEADVFNREQIAARLSTAWAGRPTVYLEETGSTNDDIFELAAQGYPHGTLAVTARQTAGKGRRGRTWLSPPEGNIYMSILLRPDLRPDLTPMLTVVMALSACQAANDLLGRENAPQAAGAAPREREAAPQFSAASAQAASAPDRLCRFGIKWPNDIVVSVNGGPYRKICGILTEMRMEDSEISAITIGIGLNVNQTEFPAEIAQNATSIAVALGRKINRASLAASVWNHFEKNYGIFMQTRDFSGLRPAYEESLVNRGRAVHVLDPKVPFTGTAIGIDDRGALLVLPDGDAPDRAAQSAMPDPDGGTAAGKTAGCSGTEGTAAGKTAGRLVAVSSGEVSVRGVNGYV